MALTLAKRAQASVVINAPIDKVWALVSDVTRTGEWSVECRGGEWLDGATEPKPGVRFRGRNRRNVAMWSRICEVDEAEPQRRFAWHTTPTRMLPDSTGWSFDLQPEGDGVRLTETMQIRKLPRFYEALFAAMIPQHHDRTADIESDLQRIKQRAEGNAG